MKKLINLSIFVLVFCVANALVLSAYANKVELKSKTSICGEKCGKKCDHKKCIEAGKACDAGSKCCASAKAEGKDGKNCAHADGGKKGKCCHAKKAESSEETKPSEQ